ncbi:hypothetical protein A2U01_0108507, partial [Trifolium medium]|nr:hypothetical protein [Trifolium medium]
MHRRAKDMVAGRGARQPSPKLARTGFASDLFSPVLASPRWASSTGT